MKTLLTNSEILKYATELYNNFNSNINLYLPAKVNFSIQKNLSNLLTLVVEIEKVREDIGKKYGEKKEEENNVYYFIPEENRIMANKEFKQLMEIEQKVEIFMIELNDIKDLEMTSQQMASLLFMIEE